MKEVGYSLAVENDCTVPESSSILFIDLNSLFDVYIFLGIVLAIIQYFKLSVCLFLMILLAHGFTNYSTTPLTVMYAKIIHFSASIFILFELGKIWCPLLYIAFHTVQTQQ
jgi:hypothetical protein